VSGAPEFTSTIAGASSSARVQNVTLTNVKLTARGGHPASDATIVPPENNTKHAPKIYGTRPAYGWWLRHVSGVRFVGCAVDFDRGDGRPAFISDDTSAVALDGVTLERGGGSPYDIGFRRSTGFTVTDTRTTTGATPRIRTS
jgi:hypothetical protein